MGNARWVFVWIEENPMSRNARLPRRLPVGSKYVLERMKGTKLVHRYVELPGGRRVELAARVVPTCSEHQETAPSTRGWEVLV
jgi:hypothetical protein